MAEPYSEETRQQLLSLIAGTKFHSPEAGKPAYLADRVDTFWDLLSEMLSQHSDITPLVDKPRFPMSRGLQQGYVAASVDYGIRQVTQLLTGHAAADVKKSNPGLFGSLH